MGALIDVVRQQADHLAHVKSRLIVFLQQLTPFVDTKDYEFHGLATRISEDVAEAHDQLTRTVHGLAAALSGVSDDVLKRWERYEGLRTSLASMQLTVQALRRELSAADGRHPSAPDAHPPAPAGTGPHRPAPHPTAPDGTRPQPTAPTQSHSSDPLSSHKYVAFEDLFRGDRALIRERQADYLSLLSRKREGRQKFSEPCMRRISA